MPKGKSLPIINIKWKGRAIVIFGFWSDGNYIWMVTKKTTTENGFWVFLALLKRFIADVLCQDPQNVILSLDNAPVHLSSKSKKVAKEFGLKMCWLPPYSPTLAPVELAFGGWKRRIYSKQGSAAINFSTLKGRKQIVEDLGVLDKYKVIRVWTRFIAEARKAIVECREADDADQDQSDKEEEKTMK